MRAGPPDVYTSPTLPLGTNFRGIVHIHGSVERSADIVLTDADWGRAYLTEGWARRFLVNLFSTYTVLFVGYSHDDIVMSYLARALPAANPTRSDAPRRFALAPKADDERWEFLDISPIWYPRPASGDHSALGDGVKGLANYLRRDFREWKRIISNIAECLPPSDQENSDLIADSLAEPVRTRSFTKGATDPEWIDWLDNRRLLAPVFQSNLFGDSRQIQWLLDRWLCERFARDYPEALKQLLTRHGKLLNGELWLELARVVCSQDERPWDPSVLSKWLALLLGQIPGHVPDVEIYLHNIAEAAAHAGLNEALVAAFDKIADASPSMENASVVADSSLSEIWERDLGPRISEVAEQLLIVLLHRLRERHRILLDESGATRKGSYDSWHRKAIDSRDEDSIADTSADVLIDAARDCLSHLAENSPKGASTYIEQLIRDESPLLRRIALHSAGKRTDQTADKKIDWQVEHVDIHDEVCRRESFRFLEQTYGAATKDKRQLLLAANATRHDTVHHLRTPPPGSARWSFRACASQPNTNPKLALAADLVERRLKLADPRCDRTMTEMQMACCF